MHEWWLHAVCGVCFQTESNTLETPDKISQFGGYIHELETRRAAGHPNVNPLVWCNQEDEDFVGRVSGYSRHVSIRTIHERTISRFQIALASKWWIKFPYATFKKTNSGITISEKCDQLPWSLTSISRDLSRTWLFEKSIKKWGENPPVTGQGRE